MKTLDKFILVVPNAIPEDVIKAIDCEYISSDDWVHAGVRDGVNTEIRNCLAIGMSFSSIIEKNKLIRTNIDSELHTCTKRVLAKYKGMFSDVKVEQDSGYDLLKYEVGGFYISHTDHFKSVPREISCSFILNDDYEGGEFAFFDRELVYKLKKGSCILFPSNFMYPHEIMPVTSGTRYSIITWFV
ncbi:Fe(II)-dependent oxygenase superfamily protein [uncultured Caudovirales phage]|uniref:Fe(II)-dependent oxygenase superfamily protein n=1 Tax=uncultured Caudovirales phage TaxID=2100421 RepID=A0A6J5LQX3_9CAUD|nr:Fe(II)-dependent oxygenase superfamily protein [uncultured Caudovirales phage]